MCRTGEGVFEIPRRKPKEPELSQSSETRIPTIAEQKVDKNIKKIKKLSKIPRWNPNEWQEDSQIHVKVRIFGGTHVMSLDFGGMIEFMST